MGLILRSSSLANPGDSVTVKGSTLDWVEGDGNFVYLLNKINNGLFTEEILVSGSRDFAVTDKGKLVETVDNVELTIPTPFPFANGDILAVKLGGNLSGFNLEEGGELINSYYNNSTGEGEVVILTAIVDEIDGNKLVVVGTSIIEDTADGNKLKTMERYLYDLSLAGTPISALSDATAANSIDNLAYLQEWKWNELTSGIGLKLSSSSTAAASNTQTLFELSQSGANANGSQTTYAQKISNTKTGTNNVNIGLKINVSGGSGVKNAALVLNASGGISPRSIVVESDGGAVELNGEYLYFQSSNKFIYGNSSNLTYSAGDRAHSFSTSNACYAYFASNTNNANPFTINRAATRDYELMFGGVSAGAGVWLSYETSINTIRSLNGTLSFSANTGLAGGFALYTPTVS